jgi:hypothetical protein
MAWPWSHTSEAYDNVARNVEQLPREQLEEIYAEWQAAITGNKYQHAIWQIDAEYGYASTDPPEFDNEAWSDYAYEVAKAEVGEIPSDVLVALINDWARSHAVCDNGGFNAWVCPTGCHRVSFDSPEIQI